MVIRFVDASQLVDGPVNPNLDCSFAALAQLCYFRILESMISAQVKHFLHVGRQLRQSRLYFRNGFIGRGGLPM